MAKRITQKDWVNKHIMHVMEVIDAKPVAIGYFETVAAVEHRAYRADGSFVGEFVTKREAVNAL